jgi:drug/metabolite transporter (DMT)-like permease
VGVLLVLGAAAANAAYQTLTRAQAQADSPAVQVAWSGLVGAALMTVAAPLWWPPQGWGALGLDARDWAVFAAVGPLGAAGHLLLARAYRLAEASRLAPWAYTQMLLSIAIGWAVWGDLPDAIALVGMALIAAGPQLARLDRGRAGH